MPRVRGWRSTMSPMSLWKIVLLFIILGGEAMGEQLWSLQPLKRTELPRAGDAQSWDGHTDIAANHRQFALKTDQGIAALLADLKQRGLLDFTLMVCCGELGRTSASQGSRGRDHNPNAFIAWFVGGGVRGGVHYGKTDPFGYRTVENPRHLHDLHATILHLCETIMSDWPIGSMAVTFALPMSMGTW